MAAEEVGHVAVYDSEGELEDESDSAVEETVEDADGALNR